MVGRDRMGHLGSVDVAANEASVYGLRDNTTEHSENKRLAEQLMRPEWAQLRREWKWAVIEGRAHGIKPQTRGASTNPRT